MQHLKCLAVWCSVFYSVAQASTAKVAAELHSIAIQHEHDARWGHVSELAAGESHVTSHFRTGFGHTSLEGSWNASQAGAVYAVRLWSGIPRYPELSRPMLFCKHNSRGRELRGSSGLLWAAVRLQCGPGSNASLIRTTGIDHVSDWLQYLPEGSRAALKEHEYQSSYIEAVQQAVLRGYEHLGLWPANGTRVDDHGINNADVNSVVDDEQHDRGTPAVKRFCESRGSGAHMDMAVGLGVPEHEDFSRCSLRWGSDSARLQLAPLVVHSRDNASSEDQEAAETARTDAANGASHASSHDADEAYSSHTTTPSQSSPPRSLREVAAASWVLPVAFIYADPSVHTGGSSGHDGSNDHEHRPRSRPAAAPAGHMHGVRLASLLQTHAQTRTLSRAVPLLDMILKPVISEAMNTIINPVVNMLAPSAGEDLQELSQELIGEQAPGDIAEMVSKVAAPAINNVASDAIAGELLRTVPVSLARELGSELATQIPAMAGASLAARIAEQIEASVPAAAGRRIAEAVSAVALPRLVRSVSLGTSTSLVPALARATLPRIHTPNLTPDQDTLAKRCAACTRAAVMSGAASTGGTGGPGGTSELSKEALYNCRACAAMSSGSPMDATVPIQEADKSESNGEKGSKKSSSGNGNENGGGKGYETASLDDSPWGADPHDATAQVAFHYAAWYAEYYSKYYAQAAQIEAEKQALVDLRERRLEAYRAQVAKRQWLEAGVVTDDESRGDNKKERSKK